MTEVEASVLVTMLVTAFPNEWRWLEPEQQKASRALYRRMMLDLDATICGAAVQRLIATVSKMPSIAKIREGCAMQLDGRASRGGEAWGVVLKLIGRWGVHREPGIDFEILDPTAARCVQAFGWRELCSSENQVADRARFIELYEQLALQAHEDRAVAQLAPPIPARQRIGEAAPLGDIVAGMLKTEST